MDESEDRMEPLYHPKKGAAKSGGNFRAHVIKPQDKTQLDQQGAQFESDLRETLRKGDVFRFRNFLSNSGRALPTEMMLDTIKMETLMHQLILTMPDLSDIHPRSKAWLDGNTVLKTRGLTLLQASRLTPLQKKDLVINENTPDN